MFVYIDLKKIQNTCRTSDDDNEYRNIEQRKSFRKSVGLMCEVLQMRGMSLACQTNGNLVEDFVKWGMNIIHASEYHCEWRN